MPTFVFFLIARYQQLLQLKADFQLNPGALRGCAALIFSTTHQALAHKIFQAVEISLVVLNEGVTT